MLGLSLNPVYYDPAAARGGGFLEVFFLNIGVALASLAVGFLLGFLFYEQLEDWGVF